jgi:hypothetical protein
VRLTASNIVAATCTACFSTVRLMLIVDVLSTCFGSCLSVRPHGRARLPLDVFSRNLIFEDFVESLPRKFKLH